MDYIRRIRRLLGKPSINRTNWRRGDRFAAYI